MTLLRARHLPLFIPILRETTMNRISKRLYLVGFVLLSLALVVFTLLTYGTARILSTEEGADAYTDIGYPFVFFVLTILIALGSSLVLLAMLGNSLRPKIR